MVMRAEPFEIAVQIHPGVGAGGAQRPKAHGMTMDDIDLIEFNEAFAAQVRA